jgi:hypothetical protein
MPDLNEGSTWVLSYVITLAQIMSSAEQLDIFDLG